DIETQFGLCERSKLSLRDIQQILRKLRFEYARRKGGELVITAGEILMDETVETSFDADDNDAETKVVTAVAWLERGQYLKREENSTQIFPARLSLSEADAEQRLLKANLSERRREEFGAILKYLYQADADERVNTDNLMSLTSLTSEEVVSTLKQMEELGLLVNDTQLTVLLRHGVVDASIQRLEQTLALEGALFEVLSELAPDAEDGSWQDLNLAALTAGLKARLEREDVIPLQVLRLLRSLSQDRESNSQPRSSFELKQVNHDYIKLKIHGKYNWSQIERFGEKRRIIASKLLQFLIGKLAPASKGKDMMVQSTVGELVG
ncbi:RecQ family ATP-dependent DNA helicase, partial [Pseudomonas aeruginosa]